PSGCKGQIFAFSTYVKGEIFYSSDEVHIRVLAFDSNGNLVAATEPSGRILRMSRSSSKTSARDSRDSKDSAAAKAEGFVLYETSRREITSLIAAPDGTIYVSAMGEKQRTGQAPTPVISTPQ